MNTEAWQMEQEGAFPTEELLTVSGGPGEFWVVRGSERLYGPFPTHRVAFDRLRETEDA